MRHVLSALALASLVLLPGCDACRPIESGGPTPGDGPGARIVKQRGKAGKAGRGRGKAGRGRGKAGKGGQGARGDALPVPPVPPCFQLDGAGVTVSNDGGGHHASAVPGPDGRWLVAWQQGRGEASTILARILGPDLGTTGDAVVLSTEPGATHPVVAWKGDQAFVAWTIEPSGRLRGRPLGADGQPTGDTITLREAQAAYPDLAIDSTGPVVVATVASEDQTSWFLHRPGKDEAIVLDGPVAYGGPAAMAQLPDGTPWVAWAPLTPQPDGSGQGSLKVQAIAAGATTPLVLGEHGERRERTTLAFPDPTHLAIGWTRYPSKGLSWGIGMDVVPVGGGEAVGHQRLDGARMLDLDGRDGRILAGWEQPAGQGQHRVVVFALDGSGRPVCGPAPIDPQGAPWQTRADVHLTGPDEGVVFWQEGSDRNTLSVRARKVRFLPAD